MEKMRFLSKTKYFVILSGLIVLAGLVAGFIFGGPNLGIDFTGGSILTIEMGQEFSDQDINAALTANSIDPAMAQIVHASKTGSKINDLAVVRVQQLPLNTDAKQLRANILSSLLAKYPNVNPGEIENVAGTTSGQIVSNAFLSVLIASGAMLIYIWIRFTLYSGIAAVVALLHDVLVMTAFVTIFRIQVNSPYIAACLTIVGYSINDTIVVFDRIRENNRRFGAKEMPRMQIADLSIKETMPRTINTVLTTLITITAVYIFGVPSIKEFSLPLIVGLVSGAYSSIFIASPIWVWFENRRDRNIHNKAVAAKSKA